jgi:hypothetical protein
MNKLVLLEPDTKFLEDKGYTYKLFSEGNILYLVFDNFPFPTEFYNPSQVNLVMSKHIWHFLLELINEYKYA